MKLNDVLTKQNLITKLSLGEGDKELSKSLKVKIMRVRRAYNKIRKEFDEDVQEFSKELVPDELRELANKPDKTEEEQTKFEEMNSKVNSDYQEYLIQKGEEEVEDVNDTFTEEEYEDILDVNSTDDVEINGNKVKAVDLMEIFYELFVK